MSATGRGAVRREGDYYATPAWCVEAILPYLASRGLLDEGRSALEPAAGDGAIVRVLRERTKVRVSMIEIDPDRATQSGAECRDFLQYEIPGFDLIITNPPYRLAFEFAKHGLDLLGRGGALVLLTRLNWLASVKRSGWLREHTPSVFVLPKRPSFTGQGTDATDYAWLVWGKPNANTRYTPIVRILEVAE